MLKYKRGYPIAMLISLEIDKAVLWKIFSKATKPENTVYINGTRNNTKALYSFHEKIVNATRPTLREGVHSVILTSKPRTNYVQEFLDHIREHHNWLSQGLNKTSFSTITGPASTPSQVVTLTRTPEFQKLISETAAEETENLIKILEKHLTTAYQNSAVSFSLEEVENLILKRHKPNTPKPDCLLLTDKYLASSRQKNRLNRLMQIAKNKGVKTRIIAAESSAGKRLIQLGGIICLTRVERTFPKQ